MELCHLKNEVLSILFKRHHLESLMKDFSLFYNPFTLRHVWWHLTRTCVLPMIADVDTIANVDSRSREISLCHLKGDILSILVKRHHLDSLIKDFSLLYKLIFDILFCGVWWHLMRNCVPAIIFEVDKEENFDSRSKEMVLYHLKCDVLYILVIRHHLHLVIKDFSLL